MREDVQEGLKSLCFIHVMADRFNEMLNCILTFLVFCLFQYQPKNPKKVSVLYTFKKCFRRSCTLYQRQHNNKCKCLADQYKNEQRKQKIWKRGTKSVERNQFCCC